MATSTAPHALHTPHDRTTVADRVATAALAGGAGLIVTLLGAAVGVVERVHPSDGAPKADPEFVPVHA